MIMGQDFVGISIVYFCHDGKGKFILAKRSKLARDERGTWDIGGGGLEFGDTVEKTLKKEIKEEYCSDVLDFEFLGFRDVHRQKEGVQTHWIALDFKVKVNSEMVRNGEPHKFDEIKWFSFSNLPTPLHSQLQKFFDKYTDRLAYNQDAATTKNPA